MSILDILNNRNVITVQFFKSILKLILFGFERHFIRIKAFFEQFSIRNEMRNKIVSEKKYSRIVVFITDTKLCERHFNFFDYCQMKLTFILILFRALFVLNVAT